MHYCKNCQKNVIEDTDEKNGFLCCTECGQVLEDMVISSDTTFFKGADGSSEAAGTFVSESGPMRAFGRMGGMMGMYSEQDSYERTANKGRDQIAELVSTLNMRPRDLLVDSSHRLYKLALLSNFTRGRRVDQVAAACLYLVCRLEQRPYMLIDFSDMLQINMFTLGATYKSLLRVLNMEDSSTLTKIQDPSQLILRFVDRLQFGKKSMQVAHTAANLVKSMKRDWITTGRRSAGVCGAALFTAAHMHGFERSMRDVLRVVHVCAVTLTSRLKEFAETEAGNLTMQEFGEQAQEIQNQQDALLSTDKGQPLALYTKPGNNKEVAGPAEGTPSSEVVVEHSTCSHISIEGKPHFSNGMCHACYSEYVNVTGGHLGSGEAPPAFKRKRGRPRKNKAKELPQAEQHPTLPGPETTTTTTTEGPSNTLALRAPENKTIQEVESEMQRALMELKATPSARSRPKQSDARPSAAPPRPSAPSTAGEADSGPESQAMVLAGPQRPSEPQVQVSTAEDELDGDEPPAPPAQAVDAPAPSASDAKPAAAEVNERPENLEDIDDTELDCYLATEEESELKGIVWHELNKDYLEKQAAKEAALAAAAKVDEERRLAAALAGKEYSGNNGKRKYKKRARTEMPEAHTAPEAVIQALATSKASTKIDYSVLEEMFHEDDFRADEDEDMELDGNKQAVRENFIQRQEQLQASESAEEKRQRAALEADLKRPGRIAGLSLPGDLGERKGRKMAPGRLAGYKQR